MTRNPKRTPHSQKCILPIQLGFTLDTSSCPTCSSCLRRSSSISPATSSSRTSREAERLDHSGSNFLCICPIICTHTILYAPILYPYCTHTVLYVPLFFGNQSKKVAVNYVKSVHDKGDQSQKQADDITESVLFHYFYFYFIEHRDQTLRSF